MVLAASQLSQAVVGAQIASAACVWTDPVHHGTTQPCGGGWVLLFLKGFEIWGLYLNSSSHVKMHSQSAEMGRCSRGSRWEDQPKNSAGKTHMVLEIRVVIKRSWR